MRGRCHSNRAAYSVQAKEQAEAAGVGSVTRTRASVASSTREMFMLREYAQEIRPRPPSCRHTVQTRQPTPHREDGGEHIEAEKYAADGQFRAQRTCPPRGSPSEGLVITFERAAVQAEAADGRPECWSPARRWWCCSGACRRSFSPSAAASAAGKTTASPFVQERVWNETRSTAATRKTNP